MNTAASPPAPFDPARVARTLAALAAEGFVPSDVASPILAAAFGNSPFLARLAVREHAQLSALLDDGPHAAVAAACTLATAVGDCETQADAMAQLRCAKRRAALAIALADIAGIWRLDEVTDALTNFADACVHGALRFVLRAAARGAQMREDDAETLEATTRLTVLAMGKCGAFEVN